MSLSSSDSAELICSILTRASEEYHEFYNDEKLPTNVLSDDVLRKDIRPNSAKLRAADKRYRLDHLLSGMLEYAPDPSGKRYVAVCLHIAQGKGEAGVVNAAKAWMDNLLLPMLAISKRVKTPTSSQTPPIESASRNDRSVLRDQVALREQYRCAITKTFDFARAEKIEKEECSGEIPDGPQHDMQVAHIIPFLLNKFNDRAIDNPEIVRDVLSSSRPTHLRRQTDAGLSWDMLRSWTRINFEALVGPKINSPTNAIYMTSQEHIHFRRFRFYLDKEAYPDNPNKYKVRMTREGTRLRLSNGSREADVEFPTLENSSVEPPNPAYLKVHAALAKVLYLCGAAEYIERVERDAEMEGTLRPNGETDFRSYLQSRIAV